MAFEITETVLQATSDAATGTVNVVDPDNFNVHRFISTSTGNVNLRIQHSPNNTDWFTLQTVVGTAATTVTNTQVLDRPWSFLRINWDSNDANLTVLLTQLYDRTESTV